MISAVEAHKTLESIESCTVQLLLAVAGFFVMFDISSSMRMDPLQFENRSKCEHHHFSATRTIERTFWNAIRSVLTRHTRPSASPARTHNLKRLEFRLTIYCILLQTDFGLLFIQFRLLRQMLFLENSLFPGSTPAPSATLEQRQCGRHGERTRENYCRLQYCFNF